MLDEQIKKYSAELGRAKIALVTSSRWGYAVQKYGEAAAAGCLIVGNIPLERQDEFSEFVVSISNSDTDEHIVSTLDYWLSNDEARIERARKGQQYFLNNWTGRHWVEDVIRRIRGVQAGQRGIVFPTQWSPTPDPLPWDG
jgi:hypothetical protein